MKSSASLQNGRFIGAIYAVIIIFISSVDARHETTRCLPLLTSTCGFGGRCRSVTTFTAEMGLLMRLSPESYTCNCDSSFDCHSEGFNPVCGDDGRTYFNDLCRRVRQCTTQRAINVRCEDSCANCTESNRPKFSLCPEEERGHCHNFGLCLISPGGIRSCSCRRGFFGRRCEFRSENGNIPIILETIFEGLKKRR